jgi:hypothetical protein
LKRYTLQRPVYIGDLVVFANVTFFAKALHFQGDDGLKKTFGPVGSDLARLGPAGEKAESGKLKAEIGQGEWENLVPPDCGF